MEEHHKFECEIRMYGRRIRIDQDDNAFVLSDAHGQSHWHQLNFRSESYNKEAKTRSRGAFTSVNAFEDRFNQHEMARTKQGDYPPRRVPRALLLAIKYLSNGVDLGYKGFIIAHKDGNNQNDSIDNLEWIQRKAFFDTKIKKTAEIGSKIGLWTVVANEDVDCNNGQFSKTFKKSFVRVRCVCGNEESIDLTQLLRCNRRLCCEECATVFNAQKLNTVLLERGVMELIGKRKDGHRKYSIKVMPPDFDLQHIINAIRD